MIVLFTDFGPAGPYLGQMKAVLAQAAPGIAVVDLAADAPAFEPRLSAYLLAAWAPELPEDSVILGVVDPGVGGARVPLVLRAGGRWYVGPDNGLFALVARRAGPVEAWEITWRPQRLSATFHGRDLFAPVAARLALGAAPPGDPWPPGRLGAMAGADWPDDLARIVYIDHYGNALTGLRAATLSPATVLEMGGRRLSRAHYFAERPAGEAFWYENSSGLAEIAVAQGHAASRLDIALGAPVRVLEG